MKSFNYDQWNHNKAILLSNLPHQYPKKNTYITLIHGLNIVFAKFKGFDPHDPELCILHIKSHIKSKLNKLIDFIDQHYSFDLSFLRNNNKLINHMDLDRIQIFMPKELLVKLDTNLYMNFSRISQITYYLHDIAYHQTPENDFGIPLENLIRVFI